MTFALAKTDRAELRHFLVDKFSLAELKDLAFDLGINYQIFYHETVSEFTRELISFCERTDQLSSLMTEIASIRNDNDLIHLLSKLPPPAPRAKIEIVVSQELLEDTSDLRELLAARLNISPDQVTIIAAAWGSTKLLISVPQIAIALRESTEAILLQNAKHKIESVKLFNSLDRRTQKAWRFVACQRPPVPYEFDNSISPIVLWQQVMRATEKTPSIFSPKLFVIVGTPGSGKDLLIRAVNDLGTQHARVIPKHTSRRRWTDDDNEMICPGDVGYNLEACDIQYQNYGDTYGIKSSIIWGTLQLGVFPVVVVSNLEAINHLLEIFGGLVSLVYVHSNKNPAQYEREEEEYGKDAQYIKRRVENYRLAFDIFLENYLAFDHVLISSSLPEDLIDQMFRLFRAYEHGEPSFRLSPLSGRFWAPTTYDTESASQFQQDIARQDEAE